MVARVLLLALFAGSALAQNVVHYTTTSDNVKYVFATAEPVARLHPGDILDTNTLDCFDASDARFWFFISELLKAVS